VKVYLASPYTHADLSVIEKRFHQACQAAANLIQRGHVVFCPVAHSHSISVESNIGRDWETWKGQDIPFIEWCEVLWVLCLDGWLQSVGVQAEMEEARKLGKFIWFMDPEAAQIIED
jgi:hypothetical protein